MTKKSPKDRQLNGCDCASKSGGSIVEVLIALVLFATFIGGAVRIVMSQARLSDQARAHYTAINIAKNRIEYLRNMRRASYEQIGAMQESDTVVDREGTTDSTGYFSRTTELRSTSVPELLEIKVTVKIRNRETLRFGQEKEFVQSYMAKLLDSN